MTGPPPHDARAEMALLGSMCLNAGACTYALAVCTPDDFYLLKHQEVFKALGAMAARGVGPDILLLRDELGKAGKLELVGGVSGLKEIYEAVPTSGNVEHYAAMVRREAGKRALVLLAHQIGTGALDSGAEPETLIAEARRCLEEVPSWDAGAVNLSASLTEVEAELERRSRGEKVGVDTGIGPLDRVLHGIRPGFLYVVAARPREGKTAMMSSISLHVALEEQRRVHVFSAEVPANQLLLNMMRTLCRMDWSDVAHGSFAASRYNTWQAQRKRLEAAPLTIEDAPAIPIEDLVGRVRRSARKDGTALVCVDYIQLLRTRHKGQRHEQLADITKQLKLLARQSNLAVLALSQLGRPSKDVPAAMPKGSGEIEEAADVVILLGRKPKYDWGAEDAEPDIAERHVKVAKNRHGREASFWLIFNKPILRFEEVTDGTRTQTGAAGKRGTPPGCKEALRQDSASGQDAGRCEDGEGFPGIPIGAEPPF